MRKQLTMSVVFVSMFTSMMAQSAPADTVVIRVGERSKIIFAIQDKKDLETLKYYNFQALMSDMITKLENSDTTSITKPSEEYLKDTTSKQSVTKAYTTVNKFDLTSAPKNGTKINSNPTKHRRTFTSFNMDLGLNNYLENGKFPDLNNSQYTVRPWGSWNVGLNVIQRTRLAEKFFLEWGGGLSWYNFKFQDDHTKVTKGSDGVEFTRDTRDLDFIKSKFSTTYLNVFVVPMIDFGDEQKSTFFNQEHSRAFRFGAGPYAGYRVDGDAKLVFKEEGDKQAEKESSNFYLNNFRYGVRFQFGYSDVEWYFAYDLNSLFIKDKGPELHAFSFGITI